MIAQLCSSSIAGCIGVETYAWHALLCCTEFNWELGSSLTALWLHTAVTFVFEQITHVGGWVQGRKHAQAELAAVLACHGMSLSMGTACMHESCSLHGMTRRPLPAGLTDLTERLLLWGCFDPIDQQ